MVIQHNVSALVANGYCEKNVAGLKKSSEKLSSGYRINRAGDDAAGLAVSEKMRSQLRGIKQAIRNSQDGINLVQTFEGALGQTTMIIHRLGELAVQAANGTYDNEIDRAAVHMEFRQLSGEIDQISDTDFNGICMLNGRKMADKFTFLTEEGVKWLTPSEMSFPEDGFISTFKEVEGFPEIEMWIDILPEAKAQLTQDKELMEAFNSLNDISVRSFYDNGVPKFSLVDVKPEDEGIFSIETVDNKGIISITTPKSGTVAVAEVSSTELPHYASSTGTGKWNWNSSGSAGYTLPDPATPGNDAFDLSKYDANYVRGSTATREERQKYLDWIKATDATATMINDTTFDKDTDPVKYVWSSDGKTYENALTADGTPESTNSTLLPLYPDTSNGPQIFLKNPHFYYDDEDFKPTADNTFRASWSTSYNYGSGRTPDGKTVYGAYSSMSREFYMNTWLEYGNRSVTLTYDRASGMWYDSIRGPGVLKNGYSEYGISDKPLSEYNNIPDYRNLKYFYDDEGKLPDGLSLSIYVDTPHMRTISGAEYVYSNSLRNRDFELKELDPTNPAAGGIDYKVAKHGAVYTYDGLTQPDGTVGAWKNEDGEVVNLEDEGVYLPTNLNTVQTLPLHDGMSITVNNPTMVGEDYIQAKILASDPDREANAFRRVYDNITYSENLILQVGSRSKDSVNFTFNYNANGIGGLESDLDCSSSGLGITELSLATQEEANRAIDALGYALNKVSMVRASFGAVQNRLEHKISNLTVTKENLTEAESGIRDTDMALEMMKYTKGSILGQAAQTMLAQANQQPQSVLQLLG